MASSPITTLIEERLAQCSQLAKTINNGLCDAFANTIAQRIAGAEVVCGPWHVFVAYDGLYYDAELPAGTPDPRRLPFYKRLCPSKRDWAWEGWRISGSDGAGIEQDPSVRLEYFPDSAGSDVIARYRPQACSDNQ